MIEILLIAVAWYACGLIGTAIFMEFGVRREKVDITVGDIVGGLVPSLFGPLTICAGLVCFVTWMSKSVNTRRVVIKAPK